MAVGRRRIPDRFMRMRREPSRRRLPVCISRMTCSKHLRARGIEIVKLTLHVGVGTFIPVRTEDPREHVLKPERFRSLNEESAARLNAARDAGRRLSPSARQSTRTLEFVLRKARPLRRRLRRSRPLHFARLRFQSSRRDDHQLPSAEIHADHAGLRIRFAGKNSRRISARDCTSATASTATAIACSSAEASRLKLGL